MQSKVSEFLKTIANKEAAVQSLTNCRSVLEKRLERLEKEKEMMTKETKDLKDEIEARKLEVAKNYFFAIIVVVVFEGGDCYRRFQY